jgi:uncharacterized protein YndB with AHSA1/START domain
MPDILHLLTINTNVSTVYKAITEKEGISGWWTKDNNAKPEANSIAEFNFGKKYHNEMRIIELIPNKKVAWKCEKADPEWVGTILMFDLEDQDDKTVLKFGHKDWREVTDFFASCNYQWGLYMTSLKNYCETGKGTPFDEL